MPNRSYPTRMTRRAMLKTVAATGFAAALPHPLLGQPNPPRSWPTAVINYLAPLARPDGGFAWADQANSHLTPTYAVIGCYRLLQQTPPHSRALAEFVRTHHPARLKKLEQEHREFEFQQVQSLVWLGEDVSSFREQVRRWTKPTVYFKQYERHGYPIFRFELAAFRCRALLGLPLDDLAPAYTDYLDSRRRANGSFNNIPAADGGDGHVLNTWWSLQALCLLGRSNERETETIDWLRACQLPNGSFTIAPRPAFGGVDGAVFTWAAVRALHLLGAEPAQREACLAYLHSLWNVDGGFGERPGWASNPLATYHVLDALNALGALEESPGAPKHLPRRTQAWPENLKVFSAQIEAHGQGSPAEAVDLAHSLRIHLWGAKNAKPAWMARAQAIADQRRVPVRFFVANEEYGTWVNVPGLGTYSHTSDIIAPAGVDFGPSLSEQHVVSWQEFRERRRAPLVKAGGRLIWQFGENEELVRMYLDESLQRGGYAAISTFHFGNPDFTNSEPFLQCYRGQIPFVSLQDAHGPEPWWFADMTTGFRTLFLATEPTWEGWLNALRQNWVAAVRHDAVSGFQTWTHTGSQAVFEFIRQRELEWRWWDNPAIQRPLVSIVAVKAQDPFEAARPENGLAIRVRCAWENTTQGLPKKPLAELVKLTVDNQPVTPRFVAKKRPRGSGYLDHYHTIHLAEPTPGRHTATAVVRPLDSHVESSRSIEFQV